jgi:hypothetical protein
MHARAKERLGKIFAKHGLKVERPIQEPTDRARAAQSWAASKTNPAPEKFIDRGELKATLDREVSTVYKSAAKKAEAASKHAQTKGTPEAHEKARAAHVEADAKAEQARGAGLNVDAGRLHHSLAQSHAYAAKGSGDPKQVAALKANIASSETRNARAGSGTGGDWDESKHARDESGKFS